MKRSISRFLQTVCLLLVPALLLSSVPWPSTPLSLTAARAEEASESRIVVSLGDSYSSGEGIPPYSKYGSDDEKEHDPDWLAHRSLASWPGRLTLPAVQGRMADHRDTSWFFAAASGAKTVDLFGEQLKTVNRKSQYSQTLLPQLSVFDLLHGQKADYVTMTIGGNDAGFADIITTAATHCSYLDMNALENRIGDVWREFYKAGGIRDSLQCAYYSTAERAGDQAAILVAGYPCLLSLDGFIPLFGKDETQYINSQVSRFNGEIRSLVADCYLDGLDIYFVSVEEAFRGHEAYTPDPYINGVILNDIIFSLSEDLDRTKLVSAASIHPNDKGAAAYAACVQAVINLLEEQKRLNDPRPEYDPSADEYKARVIANAQWLLENERPDDYTTIQGYSNWITVKKKHYLGTVFGAESYYTGYDFITDWSSRWMSLMIDIVVGGSTGWEGSMLKETAAKPFISTITEEILSEFSSKDPRDIIQGLAMSAANSLDNQLLDIEEHMADGKFVRFEDAVAFIRIHQSNKARMATADMGRETYYELLNKPATQTFREVMLDTLKNSLINISASSMFTGVLVKSGYKLVMKGLKSTFHTVYDWFSEYFKNEHVDQWVNQLYVIEEETARLLLRTSDYGGTTMVRYLPEIYPSLFERYEGNEGDTCVFNMDRQGLPGISNEYYRNGTDGVDGERFGNGFEVWMARWNDQDEKTWARTEYLLGGRYSHLSGTTGLIKSQNTDNFDTTVYFYDGDRLLASYHLTPQRYKFEISVDLTGVQVLTLYTEDNAAVSGGTSIALSSLALTAVGELSVPASFDGHTYRVLELQDLDTWDKAEAYCESLGGHLATLLSKEENDFVYTLLLSTGRTSAYFGLTDVGTEGEWKWCTGEPLLYTNWSYGEPNDERSREDYGMYYYKYPDGTWNDGGFSLADIPDGGQAFICEWDPEGYVPPEGNAQGSSGTVPEGCFVLGWWEQDGNPDNGPEPLYWRVLRGEGGLSYAICENLIEIRPFGGGLQNWERSSLRSWLNGEFYENAFSSDDKARIIQQKQANTGNEFWVASNDSPTSDIVFLPSFYEIRELIPDAADRRATPTVHAAEQARLDSADTYYDWWLRTNGVFIGEAMAVLSDGTINENGEYGGDKKGIRPAIWVQGVQ